MAKILLIDDDASLREVLAFTLREGGDEVETAADGESALGRLPALRPDVVITDLKMPGIDGMEVLRRTREFDASIPVVLLTAFGSIEDAVAAMRAGAYSYLTKPYNRDELKLTVAQALERRRLIEENRSLRDRLRERGRDIGLVYAAPVMERILETIRRIAPTDATVLITGESGTGKQLVAEALHALSDRWDKPFVTVNCAAIPRELIESELFGHERGAFTGAVRDRPGKFRRADGGTLFLDEIADLPAELQTKLLRAIETGQIDPVGARQPVAVDVRLIAATNADLSARVADARFRPDLYYRLNVIPIHLPPLRERPEDIPALWEHFLARYGEGRVQATPELMQALMRHPWPGNVRELANLCRRMVLLNGTGTLTIDDLRRTGALESAGARLDRAAAPAGAEGAAQGSAAGEARADARADVQADAGASAQRALYPGDLPEESLSLPELERELIVRALERFKGNRSRAAAYLGIPRHVLIYRMEKYGLRGE